MCQKLSLLLPLMSSSSVVLQLLAVLLLAGEAQQSHAGHISLGSSLSLTTGTTSWSSESGSFAFGFYREGGGFAIGIWLVDGSSKTVVWTANRDDLLITKFNAVVWLTAEGKLVLRLGHEEKLIANAREPASYASMLNTGNFVLYGKDAKIIWESFAFPTDTLLGGQILAAGRELFSSASTMDHSIGRFRLKMQRNGVLALYPTNTEDSPVDSYWSTEGDYGSSTDSDDYGSSTDSDSNGLSIYHDSIYWGSEFYNLGSKTSSRVCSDCYLFVNKTGSLTVNNGSVVLRSIFSVASSSDLPKRSNIDNQVIYRVQLDPAGDLRFYSHTFNGGSESKTSQEQSALRNACKVKSFCGLNSYCSLNDDQPYCQCLPGFDFIDQGLTSLGCERNFSGTGCKHGEENAAFYVITPMENMLLAGGYYFESKMTMEQCSNSCLEDCDCGAALFDGDSCKKQKLPLRYVIRDLQVSSKVFFKIGTRRLKSMDPKLPSPLSPPAATVTKQGGAQVIAITLGMVTYICVTLIISGLLILKYRVLMYQRLLENRTLGLTNDLTLRLFSYNELKKATNSFREELGKGSFGAVYRGSFSKGEKFVAVKRLEKLVEEGEKEFQAEMRAIGRTRHKNLVRLLGYCAEGSQRLLVYEYMSNGSLANLIFKARLRPDWNERVSIALDVARGLLYLHEECGAPIIHCDIKPQNILMDDMWTAKISDFGLAKLLMPEQTRTFTGIRGTRGYMAPEWHKNTPISVKADVYSYGMVLLEIIFCRRNIEVNASKPDEIALCAWVYRCFAAKELNKLLVGEDVNKKALEEMVKVGLWCIQDEPALRPTMKSVVLMLEGMTDVAIPPCPTTTSF